MKCVECTRRTSRCCLGWWTAISVTGWTRSSQLQKLPPGGGQGNLPFRSETTATRAIGGRDSTVLARVGRNFGWLAGSAGFSAVASLIYVALTARALGPRSFGSFALVMTYGELVT